MKKITHSSIFSLFLTLIFIAVCAGIGVGIALYQDANDPTPVASDYFRAFIQRDFQGMYNKIYDKEKINKDMFVEKMRSLRQNIVVDSYDISDPKSKDGNTYLTLTCKDDRTKAKRKVNAYIKKDGFFNPDFYIDYDLYKLEEDSQIIVDQYKNMLTQNADNMMNVYYIAVREKDAKNKNLLNALGSDKKLKKKAQKLVRKNIKQMFKHKSKKKKIKDYNIVDFETNDVKKFYGYNAKSKTFNVVYSYKYSYKAETTTTLTDSYYYKVKGKRKAKFVLSYKYDSDSEYITLSDIKIVDQKSK